MINLSTKVIIFNSPIYIEKKYIKEDYLPPIGQGYIATYLKENNIDVELIDCIYEHLGIKEILEIIEEKKPTHVGMNIFTANEHIVRSIIEKCNYKVDFIIGGQVVKFMYNEILNFTTKNDMHIIIGEGEYIINAIVNNKADDEIFLKKENKKVYWINKNSIYFPIDISYVNLDRNFFKGRDIKNLYGDVESAIITSRGCLYNCAFCGGASSLNRDIYSREKNKESIIQDIKDIIKRDSEVQSIRILDDLFLRNRENMIKAIQIFNKFNFLSWRAMAHINSFNRCSDLFLNLKRSGCKELFIGIESGSPRIRKSINKIGEIYEIKKVIYKLLEVGINVKGYFIYGFPEEDIHDLEKTYDLAKYLKEISINLKGNFRTSVFQFRPYHGTELYNRILEKHRKIPECTLNINLDKFDGRIQFNYQSGNYSKCAQEELEQYITETLKLNNGE
ncbi:B12-binding domain-containing radical SAM protein [Clostridium chromiireducens]|uniref:B12-binding domain-containing radical SAM protein n=1 Tax=Clostridium chromiireducens TaxID=225345 RepID=UPI0013664B27